MASIAAISLSVIILLAGYLTVLCLTPPNPTSDKQWKTDRISLIYHPLVIKFAQLLCFGVFLHHAYIVYFYYGGYSNTWPSPYLNPSLFRWNIGSALVLFSIIFVGAPIRLAAYGTLGGRFTFNLAPPNELQTTGIYAYVQHPSYSGLLLVQTACAYLFFRWDASPAIWLPDNILHLVHGWGYHLFALETIVKAYIFSVRIRDEEAMLKDVFGKKWVEWNRKTARIIPGLL